MTDKIVCVAGASGLVGSNIVKQALQKGYRVHGTMRDANDESKTKYLMALPGAAERLTLFSANAEDSNTFDAPLENADAVFISCFPPIYKAKDGTPAKELDRERGYNEIIRPVRDGCLNILDAANRYGVKSAVLCSSTSSTNPPQPVEIKTEQNAVSDAEHQMDQKKYTSAEKIVMEDAAAYFCQKHGIRLCVMLPTMMTGPVIMPQHLEGDSHARFIEMLNGKNTHHETVPAGSMSMSHIEDVAQLFIAAYESDNAQGRYFAVYDSWSWQAIYEEVAKHVPESALPQPLDGEPEQPTRFDFSRRNSLGVSMRDIPTTLEETLNWMKTDPFNAVYQ